ncbi:hypothetical protein, partial [Acinetobacter baumannii]|uniref:hypothetical protein n=1 Tax=Acinetobacter baumannii TaxID=470 RepID=UPI003AF95F4A
MQQSRSKELVLIYRKLISNIRERSTYGIRYGILNIDQPNLLFNKDHVKQLVDIELLDKNSERFHGLTEEDK